MLWLWLFQNNLTWIDSNAFVGLNRMVYLNLSSNSLEYPKSFAKGVFKPLVRLENLNLKNNSINSYDGLHDLLSPLKTLEGLLITGCYNCTFGKGFEELTSLRKLSLAGVTHLDKTLCNISTLVSETFVHLPQIKELYLQFCNIEIVEPMAFTPLKGIRRLDISYNTALKFRGMQNVLRGLSNSPITVLDFSRIHELFERGTILRHRDMEPIKKLHNLILLYMELNKLEVIEEEVFDLISCKTSSFSLAGNRLTYGKYVQKLSNMKSIVYLDLSRQHLNYDPFLQKHEEQGAGTIRSVIGASGIAKHYNYEFDNNDENSMPSLNLLKTLENESNDINYDSTINSSSLKCYKDDIGREDDCIKCKRECPKNITCICPPKNLQTLIWRQSFLYVHILTLKICQPSSLRLLDLSFNLIETWIGPVYGLEHLQHLNLAQNVCQNISQNFFDNFNSLLTLNVSLNFLGPLLDPRKVNPGTSFKNLTKLQTLDLSDNHIHALPADIFQVLTSLQILDISRNMLTQWNCTLKTNCLTLIDISDNKLETLPESFRNYLDNLASLSPEKACNRSGPVTLYLAGNPIQCNCDNRPFLRWLSESAVHIKFYRSDECHLQDGRRLQLWNSQVIPDFVDHLDSVCFPYAFMCASIGIFFISIGLCVVVYRYRWKLRHMYYSNRRRHRHQGYDRLFERDAFISYPRTEGSFIKNKLVPALEDDHGLRVWVADRDSSAGVSIAENLTHAIYASRKTVLILSRRYFNESWCNYEMNMARIESVESKRKLMIIVRYEDIAAKDIPLDYLRLLKTVPSIEYPKHPQHLDTFWASLVATIQGE